MTGTMTRQAMARFLRHELIILLLISASLSAAFQVASRAASNPLLQRRTVPFRPSPLQEARSRPTAPPQRHVPPQLMTASDDSEKERTSDSTEAVPKVESDLAEDDDVSSSSVSRTILLAVPLFCKFVVVLLIKFVTDLVVYPLLLLYRFARLTKRRILKMLQRGPPVNGSQ